MPLMKLCLVMVEFGTIHHDFSLVKQFRSLCSNRHKIYWNYPKLTYLCLAVHCYKQQHKCKLVTSVNCQFSITFNVKWISAKKKHLEYCLMLFNMINTKKPLRLAIFLRGYCTSYQKLACFVLYLEITNTFLKSNMHLIVNCSRNSKMTLKF